jgi:hypothetical protein
MTERKPPGVSFESWIDQQISDAMRRGDFDNLPGAGRPLPGAGGTDDDDWWVRGFLRREAPDIDALLPSSMLPRKQIDRLPEIVRGLGSEREVRALVESLNAQVRQSWRTETGPQAPARLVSVDRVVRQWRADRSAADETAAGETAGGDTAADRTVAGQPEAVEQPPRRVRWWRRLRRRED